MDLQKFLELLLESKIGKYDLLSPEQQKEKFRKGFIEATWKKDGEIKVSIKKLLKSLQLSDNSKTLSAINNNFENSKLGREIAKHGLESEYRNFLQGKYFQPIPCPECQKEGKIKTFDDYQALSQHIDIVHLKTKSSLIKQTEGRIDKHGRNNQFDAWYIDELPVYQKTTGDTTEISQQDLRNLVLLGKYVPKKKLPEANITKGFLGKKHSKEVKDHLRDFMRNWMSNPDNKEKAGYVKYGRQILSPAEKYFYDFFKQALGIPIPENNKSALRYWMDFAWDNGKFYIEIDGEQHYTKKGKAHDEERTKLLKNNGWTLLKRVRWSEYQKKSQEEKQKYLAELVNLIKENIPKEELDSELKDIENGNIEIKIGDKN